MSEVNPNATHKPRRFFRAAVRTLLIMIVLVAICAVGAGILHASSTSKPSTEIKLATEINKIKAEGGPINFKELTKTYKEVPTSDDAAPYYAAATAMLADQKIDVSVEMDIMNTFQHAVSWPDLDEDSAKRSSGQATTTSYNPFTIEQAMVKAREYLEMPLVTLALGLQDRGTAKAGCNFDLHPERGYPVVRAHLRSARTMLSVNFMRTQLLAFQGKGDEACQSAVASLGMLRMLERQGPINVYLIRLSCGSWDDPTASILSYGHSSAQYLRQYRQVLERAAQSVSLKQAWIADRVFLLEMARSLFAGLEEWRQDDMPDYTMPVGKDELDCFKDGQPSQLYFAEQLGLIRDVIKISDHPFPALLTEMEALRKRSNPSGAWTEYSSIIVSIAQSTAESLAGINASLVAVDVELYRLANGRLPADLNELAAWTGQTLPTDPFTGQDLIYKQEEGGFKVSSLRPDLKDIPAASFNVGGHNCYGVWVRYSQPVKLSPAASTPSTLP